MSEQYIVSGHFEDTTSFGFICKQYVQALVGIGDVLICPVDELKVVSKSLLRYLDTSISRSSAKRIVILPMPWKDFHLYCNGADLVVTIWESDELNDYQVDALNSAKAVLTFTKWGKRVMKRSGVKVPVKVAPLAARPVFKVSKRLPTGVQFFCAGRCWSGRSRKGLDRLCLAFLGHVQQFPESRLLLKLCAGDKAPIQHPNITCVSQHVTDEQLVKMYAESIAFASATCSEGWGLHQLESLCCGRAVIGADWGGVTEFFRGKKHGWPVAYIMEPAWGEYFDTGRWAKPTLDGLIDAMNEVAKSPVEALLKGLRGAEDCQRFTVEAMQERFLEVVCDLP